MAVKRIITGSDTTVSFNGFALSGVKSVEWGLETEIKDTYSLGDSDPTGYSRGNNTYTGKISLDSSAWGTLLDEYGTLAAMIDLPPFEITLIGDVGGTPQIEVITCIVKGISKTYEVGSEVMTDLALHVTKVI